MYIDIYLYHYHKLLIYKYVLCAIRILELG